MFRVSIFAANDKSDIFASASAYLEGSVSLVTSDLRMESHTLIIAVCLYKGFRPSSFVLGDG